VLFMDDLDAVAERLDAALSLARADSLRTAEFYGLLRVLGRRGRRPAHLRKPTMGPVGLEPTTYGFIIPDSPCTRQAFRDTARSREAERKPLTSANTPAKTPGGPGRARTDDLRIKGAIWACRWARILRISCMIGSQRLSHGGGGSRASADSLRTPSVLL